MWLAGKISRRMCDCINSRKHEEKTGIVVISWQLSIAHKTSFLMITLCVERT